jgi:hypothetical protein
LPGNQEATRTIRADAARLRSPLFIAPWAIVKQGTYGALGGAAALLLLFFLLSRLMVGAAVLNATLWERQEGSA